MTLRFAMPRLAVFASFALVMASCGGDDTPPVETDLGVALDAGAHDAGAQDAARPDGAPEDAGAQDAGEVDAFVCPDVDGDGYADAACGGDDCDDSDARRDPGATEVCDDDDEDCDPATYGADADADGFQSALCCNGAGNCGSDCDDALNTVNPGAAETCDGLDDDCDGAADEGVCVPCPTGYAGLDGSCTDIDECTTGTPCGVYLTACTNTRGSYGCGCLPGYAAPLTGGTCVDVDECAATSGLCGAHGVSCANIPGSYTCACDSGYGAPTAGGACGDINECTAGTHDCDTSPLATCANTAGSFTCTCPSGWSNPSAGHGDLGSATTRFTDLLDGTVRDNANGAAWQQTVTSRYDQAGAVAYCASLTLAGGGWRLPTPDELLSIVDTRFIPTVDPTYFPGTPSDFFWSSSPVAGSPGLWWGVHFAYGFAPNAVATDPYRARCVR